MKFGGLFKRGDDLDRQETDLENGMADTLLSELSTPPLQPDIDSDHNTLELYAEPAQQDEPGQQLERISDRRLTQYAQTKLSALEAFEEMFQGTRQDLQLLGTTFAKVTSAHHMTREFLTTIYADIHHANELELSNSHLQVENRTLTRQMEDTAKALQQRASALDALEQRESKLVQEIDALRISVAAARVEASDANRAIGNLESERAELMTSLASRSVTAEKLHRENEVMREKHINLSMDLDNTLKKQTEAQRRFDELSAIYSRESAQSAERLSRLANSEKEVGRMQKQHDGLQMRLHEFNDTVRTLETELDDAARRHAAETEVLKKELHSLNSKLQIAVKEQIEKSTEAAALRLKMNDAFTEKRIAIEKLETLKAENERDKKKLSTASANFSELNLLQTSEHVMLDLQKHEADELRREVATLMATVKRLAPYERLYNAAKARQPAARDQAIGADQMPVEAVATDQTPAEANEKETAEDREVDLVASDPVNGVSTEARPDERPANK